MDIGAIFLGILKTVSDTITGFLSYLPNPDPFPEIIEDLSLTGSEPISIAYYWIDQFFYADAVVSALGTWFIMFPIAWIIMMLLKWIKAR